VTLVDGAYRLIADRVLGALPGMPASRVRMGGEVAAAMLLNMVRPTYPVEARRQRVSGVVRLHAIIATGGSIKQLEAVSGHAASCSGSV
jgi:hypothetical protein